MTPGLFALVDCNNFYASCHQVFDPPLKGRAVVVLSNGDACVVARSNEAKSLGIKMGQPWFELRDLARRYQVIALSSQYTLYGDMSNRVVEVLRGFSPDLECYSIDESFLGLRGMHRLWPNPTVMGRAICEKVLRWVGTPVAVGIGPTKTLAKLGNHLAKKRTEFGGVCDVTAMDLAMLDRVFGEIGVGEVWGVGRRISAQLQAAGITSVRDLRDAPTAWIRTHFSVVLERTVCELRGISCLELEEVAPLKKQILTSKTFSQAVTGLDEIAESVTAYASRAAEKLRNQQSTCSAIQVFVRTNYFRAQDPQYSNAITIPLPQPSNDTRLMVRAALYGLRQIWRPGFLYKKSGVMLTGIEQSGPEQPRLFEHLDAASRRQKSSSLMQTVDRLNQVYGRNTVTIAAAGTQQTWASRAAMLTPAYTTRWSDLPVALAK